MPENKFESNEIAGMTKDIEALNPLTNADGQPVPFELNGQQFITAAIKKPLKDNTDLVVFGVWNLEQDNKTGSPVACVDSFVDKNTGLATVDIRSHHIVFPNMPEKFGELEELYTKDNPTSDSAFIVDEEFRGTGLANVLQAETQYVLGKMGALTIEYAGDTTTRADENGATSFYGKHASAAFIETDPDYEEGAPYVGPRTIIPTQLSAYQYDLLQTHFAPQ